MYCSATEFLGQKFLDLASGDLVAVQHRHLVAGDFDECSRHFVARQVLPQVRLDRAKINANPFTRDYGGDHELPAFPIGKSDDISIVHAVDRLKFKFNPTKRG